MEVLPVSDSAIQKAVAAMQSGGVVAHATETCYGLACDLQNTQAVEKLFAIKDRPLEQSVSALFTSIDQSQQYVEWNEEALLLATKHLPGPLTIILNQKESPLPILHPTPNPSPNSTVGVRISSHTTAQMLVEAFGSPLSTTSANVHGKDNPYSVDDLLDQFTGRDALPDIILDDGELDHEAASTVIDASNGSMNVLREGSIVL